MGYDLVKKMHKISMGELQCSELLPSYETKSKVCAIVLPGNVIAGKAGLYIVLHLPPRGGEGS